MELPVSLRTVQNYFAKFKRGVPVEDVKNIGRPSQLNDIMRRKISAQFEQDPFSTSKEISTAVNVDGNEEVTNRTVMNYLKVLVSVFNS
jgi:hypothetical protein